MYVCVCVYVHTCKCICVGVGVEVGWGIYTNGAREKTNRPEVKSL